MGCIFSLASLDQSLPSRLSRMCLAKILKLENGRAFILINCLRICLENARTGMTHYLSRKDGGDTRLEDAALHNFIDSLGLWPYYLAQVARANTKTSLTRHIEH